MQDRFTSFGPPGRYRKLPPKFMANCMAWAKLRRRIAAARRHLRLNLQTFLTGCAGIEEAADPDNSRMGALCAALQAGGIAAFDKAYVHFEHLFEMTLRGVFWVTPRIP